MKPDYHSVFRNLRTPRSLDRYSPDYYRPTPEPRWLAWVGGAVAGFLLALALYVAMCV